MKITKEEYEVLYCIARNGLMDFDKLYERKLISINTIINKLEKKGLLKLSYRDGKIYGFMETPKGEKIITDKKYEMWFNELGD